MLKKFFAAFLILFISFTAFCEDRTEVISLGKNEGYVTTAYQSGETFVSAPELARILRIQTTWFGRSAQLNIRGKDGFFCVFRAGKSSVQTNGKEKNLSSAPYAKASSLFVPLSFFTAGGAGENAAGLSVSYEKGKIIIEKRFNISLKSKSFTSSSAKIFFEEKGEVKRQVKGDKEKVEVFFPKATVKREEIYQERNKFIKYLKLTQHYNGVSLLILLSRNAASWEFEENDSELVFTASSKKEAPKAAPAPAQAETPAAKTEAPLPAPSVTKDKPEFTPISDTASTAPKEEAVKSEDFFSGLPVTERQDTVIKSGEPVTVIKPLNPPPAIATVIDKPPVKHTHKARILIDPGHGGKDTGAMRNGIMEKDINLDVAKRLYDLFEKDGNFEAKLSRADDTFVTLGGRPALANEFKADIFVSIHSNAAKRPSLNGFEVYFRSDSASDAEAAETAELENEALKYDGKQNAKVSFADLLLKSLAKNENINESSKLAGHIRNSVGARAVDLGINVYDNSIKQANFYVLRGVQIPAVLVEMGYISNNSDRKRLTDPDARDEIAHFIKDGIVSYAKAEGWE